MEEKVKEFHKAKGYPINIPLSNSEDPDVKFSEVNALRTLAAFLADEISKSEKLRKYRLWLIVEEVYEVANALFKRDKIELADALADLIYVSIGTAVQYGIPIEYVFNEVHRSNMTKTGIHKDSYKGEGYEPPRLRELLND